jgi:esterase/lipase
MAEAFNGAVAGAAAAGSGACTAAAAPTHLAVLVHGYMGTPEDLTYLKEAVTEFGKGNVLAYTPTCNRGRTKDGVKLGGERVAEEVRRVVKQHPSLSAISFVGNSLGGAY